MTQKIKHLCSKIYDDIVKILLKSFLCDNVYEKCGLSIIDF